MDEYEYYESNHNFPFNLVLNSFASRRKTSRHDIQCQNAFQKHKYSLEYESD